MCEKNVGSRFEITGNIGGNFYEPTTRISVEVVGIKRRPLDDSERNLLDRFTGPFQQCAIDKLSVEWLTRNPATHSTTTDCQRCGDRIQCTLRRIDRID